MNSKRLSIVALGTTAIMAMTAAAPALMIIDNFSALVMGVEAPAGGTFPTSTLENPLAIDCIGGFRKIMVERVTGISGSVIVAVNSPLYVNQAAMYMSGGSTGRAIIEYGSFTAGAGDLNLNWSNNQFFGITFVDLNETIDLVITVTNNVNGDVSFSTNVPGGQVNDRFSVQFSDFTGFDFSDVDGIRYEFTALVGSTSMTIEFLDVARIPEPASIAILGLLALTSLRRGSARRCAKHAGK